ncbi:MAG: hypothetical protein DKM22_07050 [Candidatus Melainabacteria bacterium]|nr:MAG: hypothetical protein DKM22_07050 [Candidatus Melainabacteria bacterium]
MLKQILKYKEAIFYSTIIFVAFVWLLMQIIPQITDLIRTERKIAKRTVELERVEKKLDKMREEVAAAKQTTVKIKNIYKPEIKFDSQETQYLLMVDDVINMTKENNLKIYSIDYNYDVQTDEIVSKSSGKYLGCQLTLGLVGDYTSLKNLLMDLIRYPYLITINNLEIEPYIKNKKIVLGVLKVTVYIEQ